MSCQEQTGWKVTKNIMPGAETTTGYVRYGAMGIGGNLQDSLKKCSMNESCHGVGRLQTEDKIHFIGYMGRDVFPKAGYIPVSDENFCFYEPSESTRNEASKLDYYKGGFAEETLKTGCDSCSVQNQEKTPEGFVRCADTKMGISIGMDVCYLEKPASQALAVRLCSSIKGCSQIAEDEETWKLAIHHVKDILMLDPPEAISEKQAQRKTKYCSLFKEFEKKPTQPPRPSTATKWDKTSIALLVLVCIAAAALLGIIIYFSVFKKK